MLAGIDNSVIIKISRKIDFSSETNSAIKIKDISEIQNKKCVANIMITRILSLSITVESDIDTASLTLIVYLMMLR